MTPEEVVFPQGYPNYQSLNNQASLDMCKYNVLIITIVLGTIF